MAAIEKWLKDSPQQVFRLFGLAGTGKTTIAKNVEELADKVAYAAFTGKAAYVLRSKGCEPANTIHSLIYKAHQNEYTGQWSFKLDRDSPVKELDLLIVDEVSMVGEDLAFDLLTLAKKVLVLGDPGQLPPVKGEGFFINTAPDFTLTEIHRQAKENPIIELAHRVREGGVLKLGSYGESKILRAKQFTDSELLAPDQVLVGKNDTRVYMNNAYRRQKGYEDYMPRDGERLICLRNNRDRGFLNGQMYTASDAVEDGNDVECLITPLEEPEQVKDKISTPVEYYQGRESFLDWKIKKSADEFTYAYAVTVHKSQGSSWPHVMVLDQSKVFKEYAKNWLYTAITRASEKVTIYL